MKLADQRLLLHGELKQELEALGIRPQVVALHPIGGPYPAGTKPETLAKLYAARTEERTWSQAFADNADLWAPVVANLETAIQNWNTDPAKANAALRGMAFDALLLFGPGVALKVGRLGARAIISRGGSAATKEAAALVKEVESLAKQGVSLEALLRAGMKRTDTTGFDNLLKRDMGELRTALTLRRAGYQELPAKLPGDHGFDGIWIKLDAEGKLDRIIITESKFDKNGKLILPMTTWKGQQMSKEWIQKTIDEMIASKNPRIVETGKLLRATPESLIMKKAAVLEPNGRLRFYHPDNYLRK